MEGRRRGEQPKEFVITAHDTSSALFDGDLGSIDVLLAFDGRLVVDDSVKDVHKRVEYQQTEDDGGHKRDHGAHEPQDVELAM